MEGNSKKGKKTHIPGRFIGGRFSNVHEAPHAYLKHEINM